MNKYRFIIIIIFNIINNPYLITYRKTFIYFFNIIIMFCYFVIFGSKYLVWDEEINNNKRKNTQLRIRITLEFYKKVLKKITYNLIIIFSN